jgi:hypothetical protein
VVSGWQHTNTLSHGQLSTLAGRTQKNGDPVAAAERSPAALQKAKSKCLDDGSEAHSFHTLLKLMSQIVRNECRAKDSGSDAPTFEIVTTPSKKQKQAYDLLKTIEV